jgi:hypothetical protein
MTKTSLTFMHNLAGKKLRKRLTREVSSHALAREASSHAGIRAGVRQRHMALVLQLL